VSELYDAFAAAGKPRDQWRVGTEHEMIGVTSDAKPVRYEGEHGIGSLLAELAARGWDPVREGDTLIGLTKGASSISIEPGGQFEHASAPVKSGDDFCAELRAYRAELAEVSRAHGVSWLSIGFRPFGTADDVAWMPKGRYVIMREYLPTKGSLATEMMRRTATVQVNLDYADADDARRKLRCAYSVTSLLTALYANSPIVDGKVAGWQSYRSNIWHDVDPDRCGFLPFIFSDGNVFEAYAEWALDVPMFFVYRGGSYVPARGTTFRQFMSEGWGGYTATMDDWKIHLSTLFPEVRLKSYIELRGCDVGSHGMIAGLGPLSCGFLYDDAAIDAATALTDSLSFSQRIELSRTVARSGLHTRLPGSTVTVGELAKELVAIATAGLKATAPNDLHFIDPLREVAETGRTQSDRVVELFEQTSSTDERIAGLRYPAYSD